MRSWPVVSSVWILGCILWLTGCSGPTQQAIYTEEEADSEPVRATQAIHHTPTQVKPVLTWRENPSPTVPLALTASDGTGLDLVSMKARVVIEDPLALTELHLQFDNPQARRREGRFEIELPPGAALSRLSMRIGDHWQEGEVVERQHARRTYETFLHERPQVDPALMEKESGNRVRVRVFPILPHERKEIIVSFSQPIGQTPYVLPLAGLSTIEKFDARVTVHTIDSESDHSSLSGRQSARRVVELVRDNFSPERDLVVELGGATEAAGLHAGSLAAVRIRPNTSRPAAPLTSLLVLFDTSASGSAGFGPRIDQLGQLISELASHGDFRLRIVSFDQQAATVFDDKASRLHVDVLADLAEARALGASNLSGAFAEAASTQDTFERVLLVSDGIPTAGLTERSALRSAARSLEVIGARRLDALTPTARGDHDRLRDLTTALPDAGTVIDERHEIVRIARALRHAPFDSVGLTVDGAAWSWPATLDGLTPGDDVLVFAHYASTRPPAVRVEFSDPSVATQIVPTLEADRPLLERAWADARIERIEHKLARLDPMADATRERLGRRIVELSTHFRVLNDRTALLVLETEADYRQFRIARRGRADILTVDGGSIRVQQRSEGTLATLDVFDDLVALQPKADDEAPAPAAITPEQAQRLARNSGILRQLRAEAPPAPTANEDASPLSQIANSSGHFLASPYGAAAVGNDDDDVWGGLVGTEIGEAAGTGGLGLVGTGRGGGGTGEGLVGTGRGGGGTGEGTIGLGNIGLIGKGGSSGTGHGYARGSGVGFGRGTGSGFGGRGHSIPRVRLSSPTVLGSLDRTIVRRIARAHLNEIRHCYNQGLARNPVLHGVVTLRFPISSVGSVGSVVVEGGTLTDESVTRCITKAVQRWRFPRPPSGGSVRVAIPVRLDPPATSRGSSRVGPWRSPARRRSARTRRRAPKAALSGQYSAVHKALQEGRTDDARTIAWDWVRSQPGDMLGLLALGETLERSGRPQLAARVYGSLIDLNPSRAEIRRAAGQRLERLGDETSLALAIDTYAQAAALRPDQPSGARLHAWALVRRGEHEQAFDVLHEAWQHPYPWGRFAGARTVLHQDLRLVAAAWLRATEGKAQAHALARQQVEHAHITPDDGASVRLVVTWETDTTDVDVLPRDPTRRNRGRLLGRRLADVRTGFGPEARVLRGTAIPTQLHAEVRYFDRGAMGHAMGTLQVVSHDGAGHLRIESRPFVLMEQRGVLDMGTFQTTAS